MAEVVKRLAAAGIATKGYFLLGGPGEDGDTVAPTIRLAVNCGFDLASFGIFKHFRTLIDVSRGSKEGPSRRQTSLPSFRTLELAMESAVADCISSEDAEELFGMPYDEARLAEARKSLGDLKDLGFDFAEVFKYSDCHDFRTTSVEERQILPLWEPPTEDPTKHLLRSARRAYFEFYARAEFVGVYKRLLQSGY
jgi:hypothetical protein